MSLEEFKKMLIDNGLQQTGFVYTKKCKHKLAFIDISCSPINFKIIKTGKKPVILNTEDFADYKNDDEYSKIYRVLKYYDMF